MIHPMTTQTSCHPAHAAYLKDVPNPTIKIMPTNDYSKQNEEKGLI
jgi:hypothetical protein